MTKMVEETTALPLAEIALNAAIELDHLEHGGRTTQWLAELARALSGSGLTDATLVPVYNSALISASGKTVETKNQLYSTIKSFSDKLANAQQEKSADISVLKEFCLALHDALLNQKYEQHRASVMASRRFA